MTPEQMRAALLVEQFGRTTPEYRSSRYEREAAADRCALLDDRELADVHHLHDHPRARPA